MKKKNNLLKDNRGAALISIMIAVAFISILASAILYMSYSNFQMKVVNYQSKVNFYGTEKDVTEVSTTIRNIITISDTPVATLETTAGVATVSGVKRYNPSCLAKLVYPDSVTPTADPSDISVVVDGMKVSFSTNVPAGTANYEYSKTGMVETVTLKGVVVTHESIEDGTVHKITTDLQFQVMKTETEESPGGIGKFSVLTDSPINVSPGSGNVTRTTMYGNVFIGPGTYTYAGGVINPAGADALVLGGESLFTQKGDSMMVFGNVVLNDKSVLSVVSGTLTVFGNIYVNDNAALLCTGNIIFPTGYGIITTGGNANNVIPSSLIDPINPTVKTMDPDDYTALLTLLKLDDANYDNDGILNQILDATLKAKLASGQVEAGNKDTADINYYGVNYDIRLFNTGVINGGNNPGERGDVGNSLLFNVGNTVMQDGSNLNATIISLTPITITNQKNTIMSQVGTDVFEALVATSTTEYDGYSESTHKITLKVMDGSEYQNGKLVNAGDFFVAGDGTVNNPSANEIVNNMLTLGGGNPVTPEETYSAAGYVNWIKE